MRKIQKEHNEYLARELKKFIRENRHKIPEGEQALVTYRKREEKETKQIYEEILGDDIKYVLFVRRKITNLEKDLYFKLYFSLIFMIYMVLVTVLLFIAPFVGIPERVVEFLLYLGNVGGLACAYIVLGVAFRNKKIGFLLLGIIILLLNGFLAIEKIIDWGIFI